ncbi:MAG: PorP/SprF family type IX secretion system membrane protein [Bacteroidota bacterium]|nr:PorP/SprF family type IX secretion system membrane protein [Bacteroidota bacterium]
MKKHISFIFFFISTFTYSQHRPLYSSYLFNEILINPASTGSAGALSVSLNYRSQWAGSKIPGAPETYAASIHTPLFIKYFATGFQVSQDKIGVTSTTELFNSYAFRFLLNKTTFSIGAQLGYSNIRNDYSEVSPTLTNKDDITFQQNININRPKYGYGIYIYHRKYFFSYSMPSRYFQTDVNTYNYDQQFVGAGYNFRVSSYLIIKPSTLIKIIKGSDLQMDANLLLGVTKYAVGGISYRINETIVLLAQIKITQQMSLGYSFDYPQNSLRNYGPSHEFLLRYDFKYSVKDLNVKTFL